VVGERQPVLHPGDGQAVLGVGQALDPGLPADVDDLLGWSDVCNGNQGSNKIFDFFLEKVFESMYRGTLKHSFYIKRRMCSTLGVNKGVNIPPRGQRSPMGARGNFFKNNVQGPVFNFTPRGKI
jgi:hypothetical protein